MLLDVSAWETDLNPGCLTIYQLILHFSPFQYFVTFFKGCASCSNTNAVQIIFPN